MERFLGTAALASILGAAVAACTETPREQLLTELATKTGVTGETLARVLAGAPEALTAQQLDALAQGLELDPTLVRSAAAPDPEQVRRQERERLAAIDAIALPGHAELVARLKTSGVTVEQAAVQLCQAERTRLAQQRGSGLRDRLLDEASLPAIAPAPAAGMTDEDTEAQAALERTLNAHYAARGLTRVTH